jgi:hypothetical protein
MFYLKISKKGEKVFLNPKKISCVQFHPRLMERLDDRIYIHLDNAKVIELCFYDEAFYFDALEKLEELL